MTASTVGTSISVGGAEVASDRGVQVRTFRQILLWPLQLMTHGERRAANEAVIRLAQEEPGSPWREVLDEFHDGTVALQEQHYSEFVTFLPSVQRVLYGEGPSGGHPGCRSPMRVFRRSDVAAVRLVLPGAGSDPLTLGVQHVDLHIFEGIDVVTLSVELFGSDLELEVAQDLLYRLGRGYPTQWEGNSIPSHCLSRVEWCSDVGEVLSVSDYECRDKYLAHVGRYRAPRISAHWHWLLRPLVPHHSDDASDLRYRLIEYHRLPVMAFVAVDQPQHLTRGDFARLALAASPGDPAVLPMCGHQLQDFEQRYCADRYWQPNDAERPGTRYMCCGEVFAVVGAAGDPYLSDPEHGLIEQFRHQYFLLFLIAHFHKAALLMMSDRLVDAINHLDVQQPDSIRIFKRKIRRTKEAFLGFTHRYWFHEISHQPQAKDLFAMCSRWLGTDALYGEVRDEIEAMDDFLDSDSLRRQANTVVRLTVVTVFGLIGTVATGFLGMNLLAAADEPLWQRAAGFVLVLVLAVALTFYTIIKSKRLSDFLDAVSDERLSARQKWAALMGVWKSHD